MVGLSANGSLAVADYLNVSNTDSSLNQNLGSGGIVWALESALSSPGVLHAHDPTNLQHEFSHSNQAVDDRDAFGNGNKFIAPLVVSGKVYIGTQTSVAVFGLLSNSPADWAV